MTGLAPTTSPHSKNYRIEIPILVSSNFGIKITRKNVFKDGLGWPRPVILLTKEILNPSRIVIITPADPSTKIYLAISRSGSFQKIEDQGPDFPAIRELARKADPKLLSSLPEEIIDTTKLDDDFPTAIKAAELKNSSDVVDDMLNKSSALLASCSDRRFIPPVEDSYPDIPDLDARDEDYPDDYRSFVKKLREEEKSNNSSDKQSAVSEIPQSEPLQKAASTNN